MGAGLRKDILITDLTSAFDDTIGSGGDAQEARDAFIQKQADAIEKYIKGAKITYIDGLFANNISVLGPFNGGLS